MLLASRNWKQHTFGGVILYFSLPSTSKKNTINKSTGIPFKKKKKQSTECKATSWGVTYIFTGERGWRGLRGVTEGSITKYTKVLFLFFTVHKRTRPHSQMRHYKINRYLLYNFWSILYRCMATNTSHKWLFGNVYRRAQLGISACSGGDVRAERECGGQSCGTATDSPESSRGMFSQERGWWLKSCGRNNGGWGSKRHSKGYLVWIGAHPSPGVTLRPRASSWLRASSYSQSPENSLGAL